MFYLLGLFRATAATRRKGMKIHGRKRGPKNGGNKAEKSEMEKCQNRLAKRLEKRGRGRKGNPPLTETL